MTIAWLAHLYTGTSGVLAFLAAIDAVEGRYQRAFVWLYVQVAVDATDGLLARRLRVAEATPWFDGAKLDDIVDYLCYVFVPALIVWRAGLVPDGWAVPVAAAMLLASGYGFNRQDAKTPDHFFTGFPSYWNVVVFYLLVAGLPTGLNAAILLVLAGLVFVPIRYLYPTRGAVLQRTTNLLGLLWGGQMIALLWQVPDVSRSLLASSLVFPAYYTAVSLALELRRRRPPGTRRRTVG